MAKSNIIGLRELRENTEHYIKAVGKGESFEIVRRSRPIFDIVPSGTWDHYIDLTKFRPHGIPVDEMIERLERIDRMKRGNGRNRQKARKAVRR